MLKLNSINSNSGDLVCDLDYIKESTRLIADSLNNGYDVAEFADGRIITTSFKIMEIQYVWDSKRKKLVKTSSRRSNL